MPKRIGTNQAGYTIEALLGAGGFGAVYRARKPQASPVAMKVLLADLISCPLAVQRFEREVAAVQRIDHENCIKIFDRGRLADGSPYFTMELLEGEDLAEKIGREGRMTIPETLLILRPICQSLQLAHAQGLIHRDIKASNIFVCGDGTVKLLDFGIAKFIDTPGMTLTLSRQMIGSPLAMAPEQYAGGVIDARTDVYALGVLAYYLLTGESAFSASSAMLLEHLHCRAARPRPSTRAPISSAIDRVIVGAMAIEPGRRPTDASVFFRQLEAAATGREELVQEISEAVTIFAYLGPCGADETRARRGLDAIERLLEELTESGYVQVSVQSRGMVCTRLLEEGLEVPTQQLEEIQQKFAQNAPSGSYLEWRRGRVHHQGSQVDSGDSLVPKPAAKGQLEADA